MVKLSKLNWKLQRLSIFFFGNVIKNLMILKYSEYNPSIDRVENRTIWATLKYRNHPSILAIREWEKAQKNVCFKEVSVEETQKELLNLNDKKASQDSDIHTKIIKETSDVFGKSFMFFYQQFGKVIYIPILLERGRPCTNSHRKVRKIRKKNIDQSAFYQSYIKYLKELCLFKCLLFLKTFLTNSNAHSIKVITPSNVC